MIGWLILGRLLARGLGLLSGAAAVYGLSFIFQREVEPSDIAWAFGAMYLLDLKLVLEKVPRK